MGVFRFASPHMLYLLLLIPALAGLYIMAMKAKAKRLQKFGNPETISQLMPEASPNRVRNKFIIYICVVGLIIVALSSPQIGSKLKEVNREGIEIMLAVDVSNSMLAQDFKPNRIERTKYAILQLLEDLHQDNIGLIVFAGDAYIQLPITSDYIAARNFIDQISPNMVSKQGTAIGKAISLASAAFSEQSEGSRVIIVISDGENHEDDAIDAAKQAEKLGIKIYTIGVGTPEGKTISIGNEEMRDEDGNLVVTKLNEETLQGVALATGGAYMRADNTNVGLKEIVGKIRETEKKRFKAQVFDEYNEQYQYFLALALILLLADILILSRKNRILSRFDIFKKSDNKK